MGAGKLLFSQLPLNVAALCGWGWALFVVLMRFRTGEPWPEHFFSVVTALESICWFEVIQIALGVSHGNLTLGIVLHTIRMLWLLLVCPRIQVVALLFGNIGNLVADLVLLAWCLTEVARYPMFIFPQSHLAKKLRYGVPILTFPMGAGAEAWTSWFILESLAAGMHGATRVHWCVVAAVIPVNLLGGFKAYQSVCQRGFDTLNGNNPPKLQKEETAVARAEGTAR